MALFVRTVALRHTPDNGRAHIDWMWAPSPGLPGPDERVLTTLRLEKTPLDSGERFVAERIHDHRGRYLWFEGEIGRGLGSVERVWEGVARLLDQRADRFDIELFEGDNALRIEGRARVGHDASSESAMYDCVSRRIAPSTPPALGPRLRGM